MKFISASTILASALYFQYAAAHARVSRYIVAGVDGGDGMTTYLRTPPNNSPVKDLTSADVACNVNGFNAAPSFLEVKAGSKIQPKWFHDNLNDDIIDGSHKGPIVTYLAPYESNGKGNVWIKIAEENYDGTQWPVDKIKKNQGLHDVTIPSSLAPGKYLMRVEILALHESDTLFSANPARGIQLYPACGQITVTGSGTTTLPAGVAFPGAYKDTDPGIHFNLYNADPKTYIVPGPAVWDGTTGGSPAPNPEPTTEPEVPEPEPTTEPEVPAPEPTTEPEEPEVPAPSPSSVAPVPPTTTPTQPPSTPTAPVPPPTKPTTPAPPASTPTKPSGPIKDANVCMNEFNKCIAQTQPRPDWTGCGATRDSCLAGATYNANMLARAKRDGKFGRLL